MAIIVHGSRKKSMIFFIYLCISLMKSEVSLKLFFSLTVFFHLELFSPTFFFIKTLVFTKNFFSPKKKCSKKKVFKKKLNLFFLRWSPITGAEPLIGAQPQLPPAGPRMKGVQCPEILVLLNSNIPTKVNIKQRQRMFVTQLNNVL